jgi:hypothetical protein
MSAFADPKLSSPVATPTRAPTISLALLLQLLTTISYVDNYLDPLPFIPDSPGPLGRLGFAAKWTLTHSLYAFGSFVGRCAGYEAWRKEYTPSELWEVAERGAFPYKDRSGARQKAS